MVLTAKKCPHCESTNVGKHGASAVGKKRYICRNAGCGKTFQDDYAHRGYQPRTRAEIYFLTVNGSGIRATARSLGISKDTVISTLRGFEPSLWYVNHKYLENMATNSLDIEIASATEAEMDEMWSFVHDKSQQYWLWWAIEHRSGTPLAFHFGTREHKNLDELLALLKPFDIRKVYADENPAYASCIPADTLETGKRNTQKIERKHLSLRTWCSRLVRKGIRFSKRHDMHRIVVALVINFWFFCRVIA
jgi:IS1 family transposase/transposase-like protein